MQQKDFEQRKACFLPGYPKNPWKTIDALPGKEGRNMLVNRSASYWGHTICNMACNPFRWMGNGDKCLPMSLPGQVKSHFNHQKGGWQVKNWGLLCLQTHLLGLQTTLLGLQTTLPGLQTTLLGLQTILPGLQTHLLGRQFDGPGPRCSLPGPQTCLLSSYTLAVRDAKIQDSRIQGFKDSLNHRKEDVDVCASHVSAANEKAGDAEILPWVKKTGTSFGSSRERNLIFFSPAGSVFQKMLYIRASWKEELRLFTLEPYLAIRKFDILLMNKLLCWMLAKVRTELLFEFSHT